MLLPPKPVTMPRRERSEASVTRDHWMPVGCQAGNLAPKNGVVHQGGQEVVGRGDGVGIAGKVDVDFILRARRGPGRRRCRRP